MRKDDSMKLNCIGIILTLILTLMFACQSTTVYAETDNDFMYYASSVGDVNNDGMFSETDIKSMSDFMISDETICEENADINRDDTLNIVDVVMLKDNYMSSVYDSVPESDLISQNDSIPETQIINYKYLDKDYSVEFDSLEQQVFTRLNDFRQRYGIGRSPVFYRGLYACDKASTENYNYILNSIHRYLTYNTSLCCTVNSNNPDTIVNKMLSTPTGKGILLFPEYYVSVGHSGGCWVLITSWIC